MHKSGLGLLKYTSTQSSCGPVQTPEALRLFGTALCILSCTRATNEEALLVKNNPSLCL